MNQPVRSSPATVRGAMNPSTPPSLASPPAGRRDRTIKVTIIGINYSPEHTGIAPYTAGLATALACRGYDVEVLTGQPHYPQWRRLEGYSQFRSVENLDGVRVRRLRHYVPRRQSARSRAVMELSFGLQAVTARWGDTDVVVCISPPLLATALCAARLRLRRHRPAFGVLVHDVYSRALNEMEADSTASARAVAVVESYATRSADSVAVIHEGFRADLVDALHVEKDRIRELRNWTHVPPPDAAASVAFRARHGWRADETVVMHAGNMGIKQGLDNVIAAARLAVDRGVAIKFALLGDGHQRQRLLREAAGVTALEMLSPVSEHEFPAALGAADILLVNELPGVAQMAMPSKLTSYFAARRPILAATDQGGFTAKEVAASGAGVRVPAGRPDLLLQEAVRLGHDRTLAHRLGDAGWRYSQRMLSAAAALDRYDLWIRDLAECRYRQGLLLGER